CVRRDSPRHVLARPSLSDGQAVAGPSTAVLALCRRLDARPRGPEDLRGRSVEDAHGHRAARRDQLRAAHAHLATPLVTARSVAGAVVLYGTAVSRVSPAPGRLRKPVRALYARRRADAAAPAPQLFLAAHGRDLARHCTAADDQSSGAEHERVFG